MHNIHETRNGFRDYYEILQLSPGAEAETIDRVYRMLVKRYHPDNHHTGDAAVFKDVLEAYRVLSDPGRRAAYDAQYQADRAVVLKIFEEASTEDGFAEDRRMFDGILSVLYVARRRDPNKGGLGSVQIEKLLGRPAEHIEFHLWYLRRKNWVERLESGQFAITAEGVDRMIENDRMILRRDRLLSEEAQEEIPWQRKAAP